MVYRVYALNNYEIHWSVTDFVAEAGELLIKAMTHHYRLEVLQTSGGPNGC